MSDPFQTFLHQVLAGGRLSADQAQAAIGHLLDGEIDLARACAFLAALKVRGEAPAELIGGARALRARAVTIAAPPDAIDTCGTGGDGADTLNISTAAAIVAAGAGAIVAKHGNRAVSSKSGSSDVLAALGVKIDAGAAVAERCLREIGLAFLFAPAFHAGVGRIAEARKTLGVRTIFNLLGPLANPAGARAQLVGVYDRALLGPFAEALQALGVERAMVVAAEDGLDEISLSAPTHFARLDSGAIAFGVLTPEEVGIKRAPLAAMKGAGPAENAAAILRLLAGEPGPFADIVALNAGAALFVSGRAATIVKGIAHARAAIATGAAKAKLDALIALSNASAA